MAVDFTDIDKNLPDGQNMGGIPQLVYFALQSDVLSWPTPPTTDTENITMEKMGALVGDIKMKDESSADRPRSCADEAARDTVKRNKDEQEKDPKKPIKKERILNWKWGFIWDWRYFTWDLAATISFS